MVDKLKCSRKTSLVKKHRNFLSFISKISSVKKRKQVLSLADKGEICAIVECVYNILRGNVNITKKAKIEIGKFRSIMRKLISRKLSHKQRKTILLKNANSLLPSILKLCAHVVNTKK